MRWSFADWNRFRTTKSTTRHTKTRRKAKLTIEALEERVNPVVIDLFSTVPPHVVQTGQGTVTNSLGGLTGVIGGSREITIVNNGPNIAQNLTSVEINQSNSNAYDQNQTRPGSTVTTRWDGNANGALDATGLGGLDLTAGGVQNAFRLDVLVDDLPVPVRFRVYTSATQFSIATINLPGDIYSTTSFFLPFSSFTTAPGAAGPANLANVGAVEMIVDGTAVALDLQLELLDAVGRVDLSVNKTVDNASPNVGDVVTYSVVVSNRNDPANLVPAIDVRLQDLLPAGVTFFSATPPGTTTFDPLTGIWDLTGTPIAVGGSQTLLIRATVNSLGSLTNYAQVLSVGNALNPQIDTDSTPGNNSGRGQSGDPADEDDDDVEVINVTGLDFGDAPTAAQSGFAASYPTTLANDGARHVNAGPTLGASRDVEADGQPTLAADGDGADENGITLTQIGSSLTSNVRVMVPVTVAGGSGFVNAWIDFNRDGDWSDAGEQVLTNAAVVAGTNNLIITVPAGTTQGTTYARFRLTSASVTTPLPTGKASNGEVEDYRFEVVGAADLSLAKTVAVNPTPNLGENVTFQIVVSNGGPNAATGVTVRDLLPAGLTYVSNNLANPADYNPTSGIWTIGNIVNNGTATIQIVATVTSSAQITNTAEVQTGGPGDPNSTPGNNSTNEDDDDSVTIDAPDLDFGDAPTAGGIFPSGYPTTLANNGARHVATGPTLGATRDSENDGQPNATATGDGADEDGVTMNNLIPNLSNAITVNASAAGFLNAWIDFNRDGDWDDAGEQVFTNQAVSAGDNSLTITPPALAALGTTYARFRLTSASVTTPLPTGLLADGEVEDYRITINNVADLSLVKTVAVNPTPSLGENVTFQIVVSNGGPNDATNVTVRDLLPAGLTYVSDDGNGAYVPLTGIWTIGNVANSGTATLQIVAQVTASGTLTNSAQVQASDQFDPDSTPGDNSTNQDDDDSVQVVVAGLDFGDAPNSYGTTVASNGARHVTTGPTLGATRDSENDGQASAAADGDGSDEDGVTFGILTQGISNTITVNASAAGFINLWIDYDRDGTFEDGERVLTNLAVNAGNNVTGLAAAPLDALTSYNTFARVRLASATAGANPAPTGQLPDGEVEDYQITVRQVADLSLSKSVDVSAPLLGTTVVYTVTVSNAGSNDATNVTVKDLLPTGLAYVSNNLSTPADYDPVTGIWTIGTIATGGTTSIEITARAVGSGTIINSAQVQASDQFDPDSTPGDDSTNQDDDDSEPIAVAAVDFGDAPTAAQSGLTGSYPTTIDVNGARHGATGPTLGATRDTENDGQPNATATGDGADEDGVATGTLTIGTTQTISITTTGGGFVSAWIDFNRDGDWTDAGEQVLTNRVVTDGTNFVVITIPLGAQGGTTFGRFRLTSTSVATPAPTGALADGEVEDYAIVMQRLMDFGDAPDTYGTTLANSEAGHVAIGTGPFLGTAPDTEANGQPSVNADGDGTDEDGISSTGSFSQGSTVTITANAPQGGKLDAFFDWNGDGDFLDANERVTAAGGLLLTAGANQFTVTIPGDATTNQTYSRFRVSTVGGLGPTGLASDGEVEDYPLQITANLNRITGFVYQEVSQNGQRNNAEPGIGGVVLTLTGTDDQGQTVNAQATTDNTGLYSFDNVRPGTYRITQTQPTAFSDGLDAAGTPFGGTAAALGQNEISNIVIPVGSGGQVGTEYNFGERGATVAGVVYLDRDRDGVPEVGDSGIGGVTIQLLDANGVVSSTTTLLDGTYSFPNLAAGTYTIVQTQPNGYGSSTPNVLGSVVVPLAGLANQNFGETLSSLAGKVYVDSNNNGVPNVNEPGIAGAVVTLTGTDVNGLPVTRIVSTGADGSYTFVDLLAGTYTVTETQPANTADGQDAAGTAGGTPGNDVVSDVTLGTAVQATGYNFGEVGTIVSGRVYVDANRNSTSDVGEQGLASQEISLRNSAGNVVALTSSQADGTYAFNLTALGLPVGTYTITEAQPLGYGSSEAPSNSRTVVVPVGGVGNQNFGETTGSLSGFVYREVTLDGIKQANEPGIAGVVVRVTLVSGGTAVATATTTTGADGFYSFPTLLAAQYSLSATQPTGYVDGLEQRGTIGGVAVGTIGNDIITNIFLGAGQGGVNYNFGERLATGRTFVSGQVFTDTNVNGTAQAGETGIAGVTIRLKQGANTVATTTTGTNGTYRFANILPGTYTIEEVQPTTFNSTTPNTLTVSVPSTGLLNRNFGEVNGSLKGSVYVDANDNGVRDAGEAGIAGVTVTLTGTDANGAVNRTATTAEDGTYTFANVLAGTYTVAESQPGSFGDGQDAAGSAGGTVANDSISAVTLGNGVNATGYNFGELRSGLSGNVYVDLNGDGQRQANEPGIRDVVITITGPVTRQTTTAPDGTYSFTDLPPGTYTVSEAQPTGFIDGQDAAGTAGGTVANDSIGAITLTANNVAAAYNFGETGIVLTGRVYVDGNKNGTRDANEPGLGGIPIALRTPAGTTLATTTTGPDGSYLFPIPVAGNYVVAQTQPNGYGSSEVPTNTRNVTVPAAGLFDQNFGETLGSISGTVYQDPNANGVRNPTETQGLGGVLITLTGADVTGLGVVRTALTDANGNFSFTGLLAGTYTLTETQPLGVFDSLETVGNSGGTRANDVISAIALTAATDATGYLFGETPPVDPFGFVFQDLNNNGRFDAGEPPIPGVVIRLTGRVTDPNAPGGTRAFNPATDDLPGGTGFRVTDANGFYQFAALPIGTYTLTQTQPANFTDGREQMADPSDAALPGVGLTRINVGNDVFSNIVLLNQQVALPGGGMGNLAFRGPLNFGELRPNRLSGRVFTDSNQNGRFDASDRLEAGVLVTITGRTAAGLFGQATTRTDARGQYSFNTLPPSDGNGYVITITTPAGRIARQSFVGTLGGVSLGRTQVRAAVGNVQGVNGINYDFSLVPATLGKSPLVGR